MPIPPALLGCGHGLKPPLRFSPLTTPTERMLSLSASRGIALTPVQFAQRSLTGQAVHIEPGIRPHRILRENAMADCAGGVVRGAELGFVRFHASESRGGDPANLAEL